MTSRLLPLLVVLFCGMLAQAQESDLDVQEVQVVEEFIPMVPPARKLFDIPQLVDTHSVDHAVYYSNLIRRYETDFQIDTIKPAKIKGEPITKLYQKYLKVGLGNAAMPSLEAYYNSMRSKQWAYGFSLGYHRASAKAKGLYEAGFQEDRVAAYAKGVFDFGVLNASIAREGNVITAHGGQTQLTEIQMRQYWAYSQFNLSLESNYTDKHRLRHRTTLYVSDLNEMAENNFRFSSQLQHRFGGYDYSVAFKGDVYTNNTAQDVAFAADTAKEGIYTLSPRFNGAFKGVKLSTGFDEVVNNRMADTVGLNFYFYPQLRADYELSPGLFSVYGGLRSGLQKNSYWSLSKANPFVLNPLYYDGAALELKNTSTAYDLYVGLDTYLHSTIRFGSSVSFAKKKDMPFFHLDASSTWGNKFEAVYLNAHQLTLESSVTWRPSDKKGVDLSLVYYHFQIDQTNVASNEFSPLPFYKPSFKADVNAFYNVGDKIIGHLNLYAALGRKFTYINPVHSLQESQDMIDIDLSIEYRYTKVLSAYLKGSRLIGGYDIWQNYPVVSPQIQLGISYQL